MGSRRLPTLRVFEVAFACEVAFDLTHPCWHGSALTAGVRLSKNYLTVLQGAQSSNIDR